MRQVQNSGQDKVIESVWFEQCDYDIISQMIEQRGIEQYGFDTALKLIIREWYEMQGEIPGAKFSISRKIDPQ